MLHNYTSFEKSTKRIENLEKEVAELKQGEEKPKEKFKSNLYPLFLACL